MHEYINEQEKEIFIKFVKKLIIFNGIFLILSISTLVFLYQFNKLDSKGLIGLSIGIMASVIYSGIDLYRKRKEVNAGMKIVETAAITNYNNNFLLPIFILDNGFKLYPDVIKRSGFNKKDIKVGTKFIINYLPKSKHIISIEIYDGN